MNKRERLYQLKQLLDGHCALPAAQLMERLGISRATLTRDLDELGDTLHAPVWFDREHGGYRLQQRRDGGQHELPGLWFSAEEIHALLTMQHLLANLDTGGLLGKHIAPLQQRLTELLGAAHNPAAEVTRRIRIASLGARAYRLEHFQAVGSALLKRQRLAIEYHARGTDQTSRREISPQRLLHYRDNWYLDAWCHQKDALRRFAVDAIRSASVLPTAAIDIDDAALDASANGYGIFAGAAVKWAVLRFSPERSRWVAQEKWHPAQQGRMLEDGSYELRFPYSHTPELLMDLLRHGRHLTVLAPPELAEAVRAEHLLAAKNFKPCARSEHGDGENDADEKDE